ncbi:MAG TPA: hypothetical protein VND64_37020 [Pirellulales bacterium]|nr:hypothetical protein [Pirellulales bacterium]
MQAASHCIARQARTIAREIGAEALLVYADAIAGADDLRELQAIDFRTALIARFAPRMTYEQPCWRELMDTLRQRSFAVKYRGRVKMRKV